MGPEGLAGVDDGAESSFVLRRSSFDDTTWLPAALLATLVLLVTALQSFGGEPAQLQWRSRTPAAQPASNLKQPVRRVATRPHSDRGYSVVQVAYEEIESPSVSVSGAARLKSVVVHPRDRRFDGPQFSNHVAQNPFEDDEISREINRPYGRDEPQPSDLPELNLDELPQPTEPELLEEVPDSSMPVQDQSAPDDDQLFPPIREPGESNLDLDPDLEESAVEQKIISDVSELKPNDQQLYEEALEKAGQACGEARERVFSDLITDIDLNINQSGLEGWNYPFECQLDDGRAYAPRSWPEVTYMWKAAANCHKPLYFEQVQLERYGHSWGPCVQPLVSGAHFFTRLPVLPYCMGITPPNECLYPLGYYRPGNCAPYMIPAVPFTWRAAAFQAGATVGTAAILP